MASRFKKVTYEVLGFAYLVTRFLESLAKIGKTGNKHIDNLLSVITMMIHTYRNKHQVQQWYVSAAE